jgi:hypothetical protein
MDPRSSAGRELVVLSLRDRTKREIPADDQMPIGWSPGGDAFYTYDPGSLRIHRHSLSKGDPELVAEIECAVTAMLLPDASGVVCSTPIPEHDLWIARGFANGSSTRDSVP